MRTPQTNALTQALRVSGQPKMMALEQRMLFDGAAVAVAAPVIDVVERPEQSETTKASTVERIPIAHERDSRGLFELTSSTQTLSSVANEAGALIHNYLASATEAALFELFNGGKAAPDAEWLNRLVELRTAILDGSFSVQLLEMEGASLFTAIAAFTADGPSGEATVFINRYWFDMFDSPDANRVLIEEFGHAIDAYLNPAADTAGDEGERFAAYVLDASLTAASTLVVLTERDAGTVTVGGKTYAVEFAAFNFVNAYEMLRDLDGDSVADNTENWSEKEQETHTIIIDRTAGATTYTGGLGVARITDGTNGQNFSGNDVSVTATIGGVDYHGWISRPMKVGGVVKGFYFWRDTGFATLSAAQADGNQDGDSSVLDNRGYILVVDQSYFDGLSKSVVTVSAGAETGTYRTVVVKSSSDRVDSALNSVLVPNSTPVAKNDSLTVNEDSGVASVTAVNGLLSNDTDVNNDTLTITGFTVSGVAGTPTIGTAFSIPSVGSITINADGSYAFTPAANYSGSVPPITYTVSDGKGGTTTAVLSISVTPVNDPPTATNDSITTAENTSKVLNLSDFGTYADTENDPLTKIQITELATNGTLQYWNGTAWASVALNQEITVSQILRGEVRFSPDTNESGTNYATVKFKVSDGQAYSNAAYTLTVNVVSGTPVATNDTNTVVEAGCDVSANPATGNVITDGTDDADPGGLTLSVTKIDVNGNTQSVSTGTTLKGQYGTLTINSTGNYSYALDNGLSEIDQMNSGNTKTETFTYTVSNEVNHATATLTITIAGTNDAPDAQNDFSNIKEGVSATVIGNALTNDSDVDSVEAISGSYASATGSSSGSASYNFGASSSIGSGDFVFFDDDGSATTRTIAASNTATTGEVIPLTVSYLGASYNILVDSSTSTAVTFKIDTNGNAAGGTVSVNLNDNEQGFVFSNGSKVGFGANASASGNYKVSTVAGSAGASSTTVNITNITSGAIVAGMSVTNGTDTRTVQSVTTNASGIVTSIVLNSAVTWSSETLTFSKTGSPLVLDGKYGQISVNTATGAYTYTLTGNPADGTIYDERFSYRLTDTACTDDAMITIRVFASTSPMLVNDTLVVAEDSGLHTTFNGNAGNANDDLEANDADGSSVTFTADSVTNFRVAGDSTLYTAQASSVANSATNTATVAGVGTLRIYSDGTVSFDPVDDYLGPVPAVTYTRLGSDGQSYTATLTITIQSSNDASVLQVDSNTVSVNTSAIGNVLSNDSDVDNSLAVNTFSYTSNGVTVTHNAGSTAREIRDSSNNLIGSITLTSGGRYTFNPTSNWTGAVPTITYTTDTGFNSTLNITVTPANPPEIDLDASANGTGFNASYVIAGTAVAISDADVTILDADDTNMESAMIRLINAQTGDALNFNAATLLSSYGITATSTSAGGVITVSLTGSASKANYQAAIQAITFSSTGYSTVDRIVSVVTNDGGDDSNTAYTTVSLSPDSRSVTVTGTTVNEASPYVQFQVGGAAGQWVTLTLSETSTGASDATKSIDFLPNLQYFDGTNWLDYTGGFVKIPTGGSLLVRTPVLQDGLDEGSETLKLTVTNQAGTGFSANSTIKDDGSGSIFLGNNNTSSPSNPGDTDPSGPDYPDYLDDDRPVTVNSIVVNEASPWAMYTVRGYNGQRLSLTLNDGNANVGDGSPADGTEDYSPGLQYWNGTTWADYNGTSVTVSGTSLLVRTAVHQDSLFEGQHSFYLGVTKLSSNKAVYGTADIYDDGTGDIYSFDGINDGTATITSGPGAGFDDDRTITVDSPTVNEASNYAVFTVTGNSGQTVTLGLIDESGGSAVSGKANIDETQVLKVWDGIAWVNYDANKLPTFDKNGKIFVRVDIRDEQDSPSEGSETFKLSVTLSGRTAAITGTASIVDDGTGVIYDGTFTGESPTTTTTGLDHDRSIPVVIVPRTSPPPLVTAPIAPLPAVVALPSAAPIQPSFTPPPVTLANDPARQGLEPSFPQITVVTTGRFTPEQADAGLFVLNPVRDQVSAGSSVNVQLPQDTFAHTDPSAKVSIEAFRMSGAGVEAMPQWLRFDPTTGRVSGQFPPGVREVEIMIQAVDQEGRKAVVQFKIRAGTDGSSDSRGKLPLNEQIRQAIEKIRRASKLPA